MKTRIHIGILILFVCSIRFLLSVSPARGNDSEIFELELVELMDQEVVTPSKTAQKISEAPGNVIVVNKQQIRERGYFNLVDLLEDLPSVDVQRQSRAETFNRISIRGNQGNFKFIILLNGFRISGPTGENIGIDHNYALFHAERVEVIYGPVSALYGRDAFTGVINIITKKAEAVDGAEIASSLGTDDFFHSYLNFGKALTDKIDLSFGGHWHTSENPDLSDAYPDRYQGFQADLVDSGGTVFRSGADRNDVFFGETGSYSAYLNLEILKKFNVGYFRNFLSNPSTTNANPAQALFTEESQFKTLIESYHGKYEYEISPRLSGISSIDYSYYELLPSSRFTNVFAGFGQNNGFKYAEGERLNIHQQLNFKVNETHQLVGGILFQNFDRLPRTADLPAEFDPDKDPEDQGLLYPNTTLPIQFFPDSFQNYGAYIQAQSKWNDWFSTTLGTRFDYDSRFGETVNPRASFIFKPQKNTIFEILYSEAFLAPSPRAFNHFGSFDGTVNGDGLFVSNFFFIPNPDLKPEKSRTVELDLTHNVTQNFIVSVSGFYTKIDDFVETVNLGTPSLAIPGAIILNPSRFENSADAIIFGGDVRVDYKTRLDPFDLKLWANYSWVDGRINSGDGGTNPIKQAAPNKVKAGLTLSYRGKYYVTPRFIWVDKTVIEESTVAEKTDPYAVVHLHAGVNNLYKNLSAFLDIRNLMDIRYFNTGRINRSDFEESPQDPRRIVLGLRYKF